MMNRVHDEWVSCYVERCRQGGMRRTRALEEVLYTFLESGKPMTLMDLSQSSRLLSQCDKATVFRLLQRLLEKGIVRRLGLHERAAYFVLLQADRHHDYLICTECGTIEAVNAPCPVHELEVQISREWGYQHLYHELEFFGVCPSCQDFAPARLIAPPCEHHHHHGEEDA